MHHELCQKHLAGPCGSKLLWSLACAGLIADPPGGNLHGTALTTLRIAANNAMIESKMGAVAWAIRQRQQILLINIHSPKRRKRSWESKVSSPIRTTF